MATASVIGCGNMGSALIKGLSKAGNHSITAYDIDPEALEAVSAFCAETTSDLETAAKSDVVFVVVKPDIVPTVVEELALGPEQTLVSIAAGVPTGLVESRTEATVVRVMPNLAAETQMMAAAVAGDDLDETVRSMLNDVGVFVQIDEAQMDIATAVNGSGPAFVFYLIQSMAEAGVAGGLDSDDARVLAAQTFKGAAETVLRSEESIEDLIDAVCSPKGTTIEGMEVLWDSDVDESIAAAVAAAERRSAELAHESANE